MSEYLIYAWIGVAVFTFFYLLYFKTAPYGRHTEKGWGPVIPNRLGWILMELPALLLFLYFVLRSNPQWNIPVIIFVGLWCVHYVNRSLIFPFRIKTKGKVMPLIIMLSAIAFNTVNTYIVGSYIGEYSTSYSNDWLSDPRFVIGLLLFVSGFLINQIADHTLINLRKPGETGYKIPQGILFKYVSSPNLLGEIIEWIGFFVMTWSLPTLTFAIWTMANLIPRAIEHHSWYLRKFPDYPTERKALGLF